MTARQVLEGWGASVQALGGSEREGRRLLAVLDGCRLLVDETLVEEKPISADMRVQREYPRSGSVSGHSDSDLDLLWFAVGGADAEALARQIVDALYGATRIFDKRSKVMKPCYFFSECEFQRARHLIDGAVVVCRYPGAVTIKLCLNTHSPRWAMLRDSPYARQTGLVIKDPQAEEARAAAYLVDHDARRGDAAAMLRHIEDKYELERAMNMDSNIASAAIRPAS